jgi:hypothetical protein
MENYQDWCISQVPPNEGGREMSYSFSCKDYPGMGTCPGSFIAGTEEELWRHIELHGKLAHQEDPAAWSQEERAQIKRVIRVV